MCPINVYDYIKPKQHADHPFLITAFLNTLKFSKKQCMFNPSVMDIPPVPNQHKTFKFPQRLTLMPPPDETHRGVEIVVDILVVV